MALTILLALAALAGLTLLTLGLRGRRLDDHPLCRRCRFDLIGVYPAGRQCPECGATLDTPRTLRRGNRRKRPRLIAAGTALLLPGVLIVAATITAAIAGYDLNRIKPVPWLLYDLRAADLATSDAAIAELHRRLKDGSLRDATTSRIIDITLDRQAAWTPQADPRDPPMKAWFDLFDTAATKQLVTQEQLVRAVQQSLRVQPRSRSRTPSGSTLVLESTVALCPFSWSSHGTLVMNLTFTAGDHVLSEKFAVPNRSKEVHGTGDSYFYHRPTIDLPPGDYEIEVAYQAELHQIGYNPTVPADALASPIAAWTTVKRLPIRVTEPGPVVVDLVHDPTLAEQVNRITLRDNEIHFEQQVGDRARLAGILDCTGCSVNLFCEIIVRSGDQEFSVGGFDLWKVRNRGLTSLTLWDEGQITTDTVDIILKPAPQAAVTNTTFDEIWGEPIIFRNVKVTGLSQPPASEPEKPPEIDPLVDR